MSPRPDVTDASDRAYDRLPGMYRRADAQQTDPDWPLLRYLSLVGDLFGELEALITRMQADPADPTDTSDLADPATADAAWLPWLALAVGVKLTPAMTEQERRDAIAGASSGWRAATRPAIRSAAATALTGTKYVRVHAHTVTRTAIEQAGPFDVLLITRTSETPNVAAVLETIVAKGAKPVGVKLHHEAYAATWETIEAAAPTWADWDALTWAELEEL